MVLQREDGALGKGGNRGGEDNSVAEMGLKTQQNKQDKGQHQKWGMCYCHFDQTQLRFWAETLDAMIL